LPGLDRSVAMTYWDEKDLPFYYGLANTFPLATRWFSSCLGPTFPNRRFLISGTAHGLIDDLPFGMIDYPASGTIFDLLTAHGISWVNYHHVSSVRVRWRLLSRAPAVNFLRVLGTLLAAVFPQLVPALESKLQTTAGLYPLGLLRSLNHLRPIDRFWQAARAGKLPAVSIVDPDFATGSEENPQDIRVGEGFAAKVINAVMTGRGWSKTLLIWLYDEHGGYYDHVAPPPAVVPDDVPGHSILERNPILRLLLSFTAYAKKLAAADDGPATYDRLGFRVPAVIVSPYAKPGYVTNTVYDHTSILKLIERKWNLPPLTRRDAAAADPLDALDFDNPPQFLTPPSLPAPARQWHGQ
jgi:phospholipase C